MSNVKHAIYGVDGKMGLISMVGILWRTHVIWPLCSLSALAGALLTFLVTLAIKHL